MLVNYDILKKSKILLYRTNYEGVEFLISQVEERLFLKDNDIAVTIFGHQDENLEAIRKLFSVKIVARGSEILLIGGKKEVEQLKNILYELQKVASKGNPITLQEVMYTARLVQAGNEQTISDLVDQVVYITYKGKQIKSKTHGQKSYVEAIRNHDIVFGIGPAGTGKTYLAVVMAVQALRQKAVSKIILTRPAVEAGEKLGFLPGDLQEKVDPYLRPLYDSLYDVLGAETTAKYIDKAIIEIAPLAYMRGRTLEDCFIILDEAQNTSPEQMKMALTRIGIGSKAIITGDITQVDLPKGQHSGLIDVQKVLEGIEGISFQRLTEADVVRHPLVQKIIRAYDRHDKA